MSRHPAKYSDSILAVLRERVPSWGRVLDPMAGVGRLALVRPDAYLNELEPEWAEDCRTSFPLARVTCGDARHLPYEDGYFAAICTSPTYGNRMADHHNATERCRFCRGQGATLAAAGNGTLFRLTCPKCGGAGRRVYKRNTYRHSLERTLTPGNTGGMQWGEEYRGVHREIWAECDRVLEPGGRLILNVSNHIRKGVEVDVTAWHCKALDDLGFVGLAQAEVETPRNRMGADGNLRVGFESVLSFRKPL